MISGETKAALIKDLDRADEAIAPSEVGRGEVLEEVVNVVYQYVAQEHSESIPDGNSDEQASVNAVRTSAIAHTDWARTQAAAPVLRLVDPLE